MPESPWSFLVMPYRRRFNYPPFHCRNEFLEAMTQFMEVILTLSSGPVTDLQTGLTIHARPQCGPFVSLP
jgi:hypothetical protein